MAGILWSGFEKSKLKSHLAMSMERIKLQQNKRANEIRIERREIGVMLDKKQFDKARIRVESVIRKEGEGQACDLLSTMCDLLVTRVALIASEKACPADLLESVSTIIWATKRLTVDELAVAREQLIYKYGDALAEKAMRGEHVNAKVLGLLTTGVPSDATKAAVLTSIAKDYKVADFDAARDMASSEVGLVPGSGGGGAAGGAGGGGGGGGEVTIVGPGGSRTTIILPAGAGTTVPPVPAPVPAPAPAPVPTPASPPVATVMPGLVYFDPATGAPVGGGGMPYPYGGAGAPGGAPGGGAGGMPYPYGGSMGVPAIPGMPYAPLPYMAMGGGAVPGVLPPPYSAAPPVAATPGYSFGRPAVASTAAGEGADPAAKPAAVAASPAATAAGPAGTLSAAATAEAVAIAAAAMSASGIRLGPGATMSVVNTAALNPEAADTVVPPPGTRVSSPPEVPVKAGGYGSVDAAPAPPGAAAAAPAPSSSDLAARFARMRAGAGGAAAPPPANGGSSGSPPPPPAATL